jgi:bifunctional non-homologous end joining protein LigD
VSPDADEVAPSGPMWWHEINHDARCGGHPGIRSRTRRGYDWTERFPLILEATGWLRATSFVLDERA